MSRIRRLSVVHLVIFLSIFTITLSMPISEDENLPNTTIESQEDIQYTTEKPQNEFDKPQDEYDKPMDYPEEFTKPPKTRTFGFIIKPLFFVKPFYSKFQINLGGSAQFQHYPYYDDPYYYTGGAPWRAANLLDIPKNLAKSIYDKGSQILKKIGDVRLKL